MKTANSLAFLMAILLSGCDLIGTDPLNWGIYLNEDDTGRMNTAIHTHDHAMVKKLVEDKHFDVNAIISERYANRPLHVAAYYGNMEMVQYFLEKGADINAKKINAGALTPLHTAIWKQHHEVALYLLDHGADYSIRVGSGMSTCQFAKNIYQSKNNRGMYQVIERLPGCKEENSRTQLSCP
jgi:ankyrin repeat protein